MSIGCFIFRFCSTRINAKKPQPIPSRTWEEIPGQAHALAPNPLSAVDDTFGELELSLRASLHLQPERLTTALNATYLVLWDEGPPLEGDARKPHWDNVTLQVVENHCKMHSY